MEVFWIVLAIAAGVFIIVAAYNAVYRVRQAQVRNVERFGRYRTTLEPGPHVVIPFVDQVRPAIDLRERVLSLREPVITKDNVDARIHIVLFFKVMDGSAPARGRAGSGTGHPETAPGIPGPAGNGGPVPAPATAPGPAPGSRPAGPALAPLIPGLPGAGVPDDPPAGTRRPGAPRRSGARRQARRAARAAAIAQARKRPEYKAQYKVQDYVRAIEKLTGTELRNLAGTMLADDLVTSRDRINRILPGQLSKTAGGWGLTVTRVEVMTFELPPAIRDAMEVRRGQILRADGEAKAIQTVLDAINTQRGLYPNLLAYRYLRDLLVEQHQHNGG